MNYATWKLKFTKAGYGSGPEEKLAKNGIAAEGGWLNGQVEDSGIILGYLSEEVNEADFTNWELKNITQEEALAFALAINPEAYLLESGKIGAPIEETLI